MFILVDCQDTNVQREVRDALVVAGLGQFLHEDGAPSIVVTDRRNWADTAAAATPGTAGTPAAATDLVTVLHLGVDFQWPTQAQQLISALSRWAQAGKHADALAGARASARAKRPWLRQRRASSRTNPQQRAESGKTARAGTCETTYPLHAFIQVGRPVLAHTKLAWDLAQRTDALLLDLSDDPAGWKLAEQRAFITVTWGQVNIGQEVASARLPYRALAVLSDRQAAPPPVSSQLWAWLEQLRAVRPLVVNFGLAGPAHLAAWEQLLRATAAGCQAFTGREPTSERGHPFWTDPQWVVAAARGPNGRLQTQATLTRLQQLGATIIHSASSPARLRKSLKAGTR